MSDDADDDGPGFDLGAYTWNLKRAAFHSERVGAGTIVSVLDDDGETYDLDEIDDFVRPVIAIVRADEGEFAGEFFDVDITEPDGTFAANMLN